MILVVFYLMDVEVSISPMANTGVAETRNENEKNDTESITNTENVEADSANNNNEQGDLPCELCCCVECECEDDGCDTIDEEDEDAIDDQDIVNGQDKYRNIIELEEQEDEYACMMYHQLKNSGDWYLAKMIIAKCNDITCSALTNKVFYFDLLDIQLQQNADCFENIHSVYYKSSELDVLHQFAEPIAKYIVDNLRINEFRPNGLIFNADNKWDFQITVVTSKGVYSANRYIGDGVIGFHI